MICFVLLFSVSFLFSACQPTPDVPPLANRSEGLSSDIVIAPLPDSETKVIDAPDHWIEQLERRNGKVIINADAQVKVPATSNTPVYEFAQTELTQSDLEKLIRYFVGDTPIYKIPFPNKSDLGKELLRMENKEGIYASPFLDDMSFSMQRIKELMSSAPDELQKEAETIAYQKPEQTVRDYIMNGANDEFAKLEQETAFHAVAESGAGKHIAYIDASRYDSQNGTISYFSFVRGTIYTEKNESSDIDTVNTFSSYVDTSMEALGKVDVDWLNREKDWLTAFDEVLQKMGVDQQWAQDQADTLLADLGIEGRGLSEIQKGIQLPNDTFYVYKDKTVYDPAAAKPGYAFTYFRKVDGLLSKILEDQKIDVPSSSDPPVKPDFFPECITVFVTEDGVQEFIWESMSHTVSCIAENTRLLPFEEIKEKFADQLNFFTDAQESAADYRNEIYNVELRLASTTAYRNPSNIWLIPVWVFEYHQYVKIDKEEFYNGDLQFQISALDGGFVLGAGGVSFAS